MKFEDWHVVENKETHQQHIFCGAMEDNIKELDTYIEIPFSEWSVDHMIKILGNVLEDINLHRMVNMPSEIHRLMTESDISENDILKLLKNYFKNLRFCNFKRSAFSVFLPYLQ